MLKSLVVEDEEMSKKLIEKFIDQTDFLHLEYHSPSAEEALNYLSNNSVDLIFLDIEMPGMSGMELLDSLTNPPLVIITTSNKEYALKSYDYDVIDFIVKPVEYPRFYKAVTKAKEWFEMKSPNDDTSSDEIYIRSDSKIKKMNLSEITYVEALADYVMINDENGKNIVHSTMKGMANKLPEDQFVRVHRSFIVNLKKVDSIEDMSVVVGKKIIPIGASFKDSLFSKIKLF